LILALFFQRKFLGLASRNSFLEDRMFGGIEPIKGMAIPAVNEENCSGGLLDWI
jgi:hypothetical protein